MTALHATLILLATLVYTYVGYPLLVCVLARAMPLRIRIQRDYEPSVSICIPVYNAASSMPAKLESLLTLDYPQDRVEILVCSDGSTDDIAHVMQPYLDRYPHIVLTLFPQRRGKPAMLNEMRRQAQGDVLLLTDARQTLDAGALRAMLMQLSDRDVACVSCSLVLKGQCGAQLYWRYEKWIRRNEARFRSMVGATGACYVIRKEDMPVVPEDTLVDDLWIPMTLRLRHRLLLLCEQAVVHDTAFADTRELSRKVRTLAGNFQVFVRLPMLSVPFVNPSFFETLSHKHLRLLSPYLACALFVFSGKAALAPSLPCETLRVAVRVLFLLQIAFCAAAMLGGRVGRMGNIARSFVVLNWAAVVGLWRFVRGTQKVTW